MIIDGAARTAHENALWRAHATELIRYASLLVGPHDAPDLVSASFLRASPALRVGRVDQPRAYLFRAVTNAAHDLRRREARRWAHDLGEVVTDAGPAAEPELDVRNAVAELSIRQRAVVYLVYWEDMTERSIADFLGLSLGTVRRHLVRAQAHLRKALR